MITASEQKVETSKIPGNRWRIEQPFCHRLAHHLAFTKSAQEPLGVGEVPPRAATSTTETTRATPAAVDPPPSLSDAPSVHVDDAWQPAPTLEAEARRRGYYAVLGAHGVEDSTTAFRDYYDGQVLRPTRWLKWVGADARKHPDWRRARAPQDAAAAPPALELWQQPAPD
jgi:hypothetical protein